MSSSSPPVANPDSANVSEAGPLTVSGNVLNNDTDPSGLALSVATVDGQTISSTTTIVDAYGTLVIAPGGSYTYTLNETFPAVLGLATGQTVPDAFSYTVSDGQTYTTTTTEVEQNYITQSEAFDSSAWVKFSSGTAPTVTANVAPGPNGGASTADEVTLSSAGSGLYYVTNVSGQYTFSVWVKAVSGSGTFSLNYWSGSTGQEDFETVVANGTWQRVSLTFTGDGNANSNVALMLTPSQTSAGTFEFWGAQLNSGATPDTYVATSGTIINTTTTVTTPVVSGSTLTVDVTGAPPTAAPDTASVTEDSTLTASGNVLLNDTAPAGETLSVASVNGTTISGSTTIVGTYGTLVIAPSGSYTYTLANGQANVRALAQGQVVTDSFAYTVSDGLTYTTSTTQVEQNFITQSEAFDSSAWVNFKTSGAAPTVTANVAPGPNGGASTADEVTLSSAGSGLYYVTNVSGQYTFSVWVKAVSGSGTFTLNYYSGSTGQEDYETVTANGTWQRVSLTFTGDGNANSNVALMLTPSQTSAGTFEFWGAQLNSGATPDNYVATTGTIINTTTTSTTPVVTGSTLTVSVNGDGALPTAAPDTAAVTEDGTLTATGNVLANDTTPPGTTLTVASVDGIAISNTTTIVGTYGALVISPNGSYTYTLANGQANVRALANGQVVTDTFTYAISDGAPVSTTTTETLQNFITESEAFDSSIWTTSNPSGNPPVVVQANVATGPNGGASTADQLNLSGPGSQIATLTNLAGVYTFSVWVRLVSGSGAFALEYTAGSTGATTVQTEVATGTWQRFSLTFTGDGNAASAVAILHTALEANAGVFQVWGAQINSGTTPGPYVATTGSIINTSTTVATPIGSTLSVSVTGQTPTAAPDNAAVSVQGAQTASGNLLANDTAPPGTTLSVASVDGIAVTGPTTVIGTYGALTVQPDGAYTYVLAANTPIVESLAGNQTEPDLFSYTISDGLSYQTSTLSVAENLISQSDSFGSSAWGEFGSPLPTVTSNVAPGPQGGANTADEVTLSSADSGLYYVTNAPGTYTFSVWVKLVSGNPDFSLNYYYSSGGLDYTAPEVATSSWQQFSFTFIGDGSASSNVAIMHNATQSATGTFEIWGAQLNPGSTPESYVPTSGSPSSSSVTTTATAQIGSTLDVSVTGTDSGKAGPALNLQSTTQGAVANLSTDQTVTPLAVLPLGDSITLGWTQEDWSNQANISLEPGYRGPLWQDFVNSGALINLIGPNTDGPPSLPDQSNAGFPGDTTAQLLARLPGILAQEQPGAVLLMAGTNDLLQGVPQATTIANLTAMINMIEAANPATHVYVATLPYLSADSVTSLNSAITTMVSQASSSGKKVSLVSMSNITSAYIGPDGTHPTAAGYSLIAQNWYNAILAAQPEQGGTPGGSPTSIPITTANLIGGSGPDFLIGNSGNNIITAGSGSDVLSGGGGNDTLVGGAGVDMFRITANAGTVTILDFAPAQGDFLDWNEIPGLTSASALNGVTTHSAGQTTINLSTFGVNEQVILAGYTGSLSNSIFT